MCWNVFQKNEWERERKGRWISGSSPSHSVSLDLLRSERWFFLKISLIVGHTNVLSNVKEGIGKSIMIVWHRSLFEVNFTSVKYWIFSMLNTQSLNYNGIPSFPFSSSSSSSSEGDRERERESEREKERRTEKVNGALFSFFEKESVGKLACLNKQHGHVT